MNKTTRNLLLAGVGLLVFVGVRTGLRAAKAAKIFEKMDIEPYFLSNVKIGRKITFDLDVRLTNNSDDDLFLSGMNVAKLTKLSIYYEGRLFAVANVNATEVSVPAHRQLIIHKIPVESAASTLVDLPATIFTNFKTDKISVIGVVEAFGTEYTIGE